MSKLRVALVGTGTIARGHYIPQIQDMDHAELVAVCDAVPSLAHAAAADFGIPHVFCDVDEMLAGIDFDVLVNTTAIQAHFPINLKALQAGKHIYSQKPLTTTVEEATILIDTAREKGLKISASPIHMLRPTVQRIKQMLDKGAIGKVAFARMRSSHGGPEYYQVMRQTDPSWFYRPGAGPLYDLGVHGLHTITGLLGPARAVACMSGISEPTRTPIGCGGEFEGIPFDVQIDDQTLVMLDFGDSTFAFLDCTYCVKAYEGPNLEIFGSRGTISSSRIPQSVVRMYRAIPEGGQEREWFEPEMPEELRYQSIGVKDLIDAVIEGREPVLSAEHARHVIEIMCKCYVAAREGRTIPLETTF
ncbi:MAG: Gfo/Idh/MocA family protein [Anaerolineae bacterium]|jgi:UDP-N-acetyl-2-amino-2-deoxyglucuronate dehydrogenase